jgi:hypothetical protein
MNTKPTNYMLEQNLCKAIKGKNMIELRYKNDIVHRTFEPYIIFEEPHSKTINLAGYMTTNPNDPILQPEWRKFTVGLIADFKMLSGTFRPKPIFSSYDSKIYGFNVLCAVDR